MIHSNTAHFYALAGPDFIVDSAARLNAADGMATPLAQEAYEKMFRVLGRKPSHSTLAFNWAKLVELIYASERVLELAKDKDITSKDLGTIPERVAGEGVGCLVAPRGTLFHHYWTDEQGIITTVNLIVATGQNNAGMCMSIKKGKVSEGLFKHGRDCIQGIRPMPCLRHARFPGTHAV